MNQADPAVADELPAFKKSKIVAVLLSLFQPGFGQLYAGRPTRAVIACGSYVGAALLFVAGLIGRSFTGAAAAVAILATVRAGAAIDAGFVARRPVSSNPLWQRWYSVLVFALIFQLGLGALLPGVQRLKTYKIPSGAMEPTLVPGDRLVAALDAYDEAAPAHNAVVIYTSPVDPAVELVKRVVALPGETVEIRNKVLYLDGRALDEPWVVHKDQQVGRAGDPSQLARRDQMPPLVVPPGHFFALGDNRDLSFDSRFYGPVPLENLRGKALYVHWPLAGGRMGTSLERWPNGSSPAAP